MSLRDVERMNRLVRLHGWTVAPAASNGLLVATKKDRSVYGSERVIADVLEKTGGKKWK